MSDMRKKCRDTRAQKRGNPDVRAQHNALERERQAQRRENIDVRAQHNASERERQAQQRENPDVRAQHNTSERERGRLSKGKIQMFVHNTMLLSD